MTEDKPKRSKEPLIRWTKKLDEMHQYEHPNSTTICGKPMLGNNYAQYFRAKEGVWSLPKDPEYDRKMCEGCIVD